MLGNSVSSFGTLAVVSGIGSTLGSKVFAVLSRQPCLEVSSALRRGPRDHIKRRILQTTVSGIDSGLGTRM